MAKCSQASASVMAITKCLIWVPPVNRFTVAARASSPCDRTSDDALYLMEKNMSKTDDTLKLDHAKLGIRVLADSELDAVTGGKLLRKRR